MQKSKISQWQEAIDTYEELIEISEDEVKINQWKEAIDTYKDLIEDAQESNSEGSKEISVVEKVKPTKNAPLVSKEIKEEMKQLMTYAPKRDKEYLEERPTSHDWYDYMVYIYIPEINDYSLREFDTFNGLNKVEQDVARIIESYPDLHHIDFQVYTDINDWDNFTIYEHPQVVSKESKIKIDEISKNYEEQYQKYYKENGEYPDEKLEYAIYEITNDSMSYDLYDIIPFSNVENIEKDIKKIINSNKNLHHIEFRYPMSFGQGDVNEFTIYESEQQAPLVSKENKKVDSDNIEDFDKEANYKLSSNQVQFVRDAIASGLEVDYGYTSKGKYEEQVPCVVIPYIDLLETSSYYKTDVDGKNIIAFAPRGRDYMARGGQSRNIEVGDIVNVRSINKSGVVMECMNNNTCLVKFPSQQHDGYYNLSDLYLLTNDDEFAHGGSIEKQSNLSRMSALAKMLNYSQSLHKQARGGVMSDESFDSIVKNVSQRYEGKKVPKEYQKEYGKRYSKKESQQVGYKVANKINSRKLQ